MDIDKQEDPGNFNNIIKELFKTIIMETKDLNRIKVVLADKKRSQ